ncbi:MAG: hypothetical protein ABGY72_10365 [bacterium]
MNVTPAGDLTSSAGISGSATDTLVVDPRPTELRFTKEFTDDLYDVIPGLLALDLPTPDVCGPRSVLSGTDLLLLTDASLPPGGLCAIPVTLQLPGTAGTFTNTTTDLLVGGQPVASPATDTLVAEPLPVPE